MTNSAKRKALFLILLTALITMLLAAALPQMELQKGIPLPGGVNTVGESPTQAGSHISINISTFIKVVFSILLVLMVIYILSKARARPDWKEISQVSLALLLLSLVIAGVLFASANAQISTMPLETEVLPTEVRVAGPDLAPVPGALLWLVWISMACIVLLLVVALLRMRSSTKRPDPLVLEAVNAVNALKAGEDLRNVIIRCYRQMSLIMQDEQGLTRDEAMTAREFEVFLETRGVPNHPVHQLTRLFESARYGAQNPEPDAEQQAIECLNAIIHFSQKKEATLLK